MYRCAFDVEDIITDSGIRIVRRTSPIKMEPAKGFRDFTIKVYVDV